MIMSVEVISENIEIKLKYLNFSNVPFAPCGIQNFGLKLRYLQKYLSQKKNNHRFMNCRMFSFLTKLKEYRKSILKI